MTTCRSECDCNGPDILLGIDHAPDCHSRRECGESGYCDKHFEEEMREHQWLRHASKYTVMPIDEAYYDELRLAGRGHLVSP